LLIDPIQKIPVIHKMWSVNSDFGRKLSPIRGGSRFSSGIRLLDKPSTFRPAYLLT
jgi:hypothetical protein